jgi:hypothetical protein
MQKKLLVPAGNLERMIRARFGRDLGMICAESDPFVAEFHVIVCYEHKEETGQPKQRSPAAATPTNQIDVEWEYLMRVMG